MPERSGEGPAAVIDAGRVVDLIARERATYAEHHPSSRKAFAAAGTNLLGGVPMTWMRMWPGGFPLYLASARGARLTDIDGNTVSRLPGSGR
jgi:glutamate-1-semialdehyde 2,1-aminomutase